MPAIAGSAGRKPVARTSRSNLTLLGFTGILMVAGGAQPPSKHVPATTAAPAAPTVVTLPAHANKVDLLGIWIAAARETITRVGDYQGTFTKRERIDGVLQDEQAATIKVRSQPFSVFVKFVAPRAVAGKEGCYVSGRHNGKMKAKSSGALALVGYVTMDPRDPKVLHGTRHSITEAGIGNLIERLASAQAQAKAAGRVADVTYAEALFHGRACVRLEATDAGADGIHYRHRTAICFDKGTNLPVRYEAYDRDGDLVEAFSYTDLHFNIGLTDAAFP